MYGIAVSDDDPDYFTPTMILEEDGHVEEAVEVNPQGENDDVNNRAATNRKGRLTIRREAAEEKALEQKATKRKTVVVRRQLVANQENIQQVSSKGINPGVMVNFKEARKQVLYVVSIPS